MNELLDVMDLDKNLKGSYIVMDNASIHKSQPIIRKIKSKGYHVMFVSWFSA
jgi:transposase